MAMFASYQRSEQTVALTLVEDEMELVVNGVSTHKADRITEEWCGTSFAMSTVSDLLNALDPVGTDGDSVERRKRLRTTNGVERLNDEIGRRERVIRIVPSFSKPRGHPAIPRSAFLIEKG